MVRFTHWRALARCFRHHIRYDEQQEYFHSESHDTTRTHFANNGEFYTEKRPLLSQEQCGNVSGIGIWQREAIIVDSGVSHGDTIFLFRGIPPSASAQYSRSRAGVLCDTRMRMHGRAVLYGPDWLFAELSVLSTMRGLPRQDRIRTVSVFQA